jgi:hypothetical protein
MLSQLEISRYFASMANLGTDRTGRCTLRTAVNDNCHPIRATFVFHGLELGCDSVLESDGVS